jgi:hypothetical protein
MPGLQLTTPCENPPNVRAAGRALSRTRDFSSDTHTRIDEG